MPTVGELKMSPGKSAGRRIPIAILRGKWPGQAITASRWIIRTRGGADGHRAAWECTATRFRKTIRHMSSLIWLMGSVSDSHSAAITIENDHCLSGYRRLGAGAEQGVLFCRGVFQADLRVMAWSPAAR